MIPFSTVCANPIRDHPFKTSPFFRGGGGSPLPMFADARGAGVLEMPTSAIFESMETNSSAATCFSKESSKWYLKVLHDRDYSRSYQSDPLTLVYYPVA